MAINGQLSADVTNSVVQTTDGSTSTTIYTTPAFLANDGGQIVTLDIVGFDFTNDEVATAKIVVKLKNVSGTPAIVGTPIHLVPFSAGSSSSLVTCSATVIIDGTDIKVNVIGVDGKTIDWTCNRYPSLSILDNWTAVPTPEDGYIQSWIDARSRWEPVSRTIAITGAVVGGDLSGTLPDPSVIKLNGATSPLVGGLGLTLNAGNVLQANGASNLTYAPINLAGGANYVTGVLPKANQGAQDMAGDVTGSTAVSVVAKVNGITYPAGPLTTGTIPRVTGASTVAYGALDLANASAVTGQLPSANQAAQTLSGEVTGTTAASVVTMAGDVTGTASASTVVKLRGKTINSNVASLGAAQDGYLLAWDNGSSEFIAANKIVGTRYVTSTINSNGTSDFASLTLPSAASGKFYGFLIVCDFVAQFDVSGGGASTSAGNTLVYGNVSDGGTVTYNWTTQFNYDTGSGYPARDGAGGGPITASSSGFNNLTLTVHAGSALSGGTVVNWGITITKTLTT